MPTPEHFRGPQKELVPIVVRGVHDHIEPLAGREPKLGEPVRKLGQPTQGAEDRVRQVFGVFRHRVASTAESEIYLAIPNAQTPGFQFQLNYNRDHFPNGSQIQCRKVILLRPETPATTRVKSVPLGDWSES